MLLQWMMANGLVPDLDSPDTWAISLCCRDTWDFFKPARTRDLGIRAGWDIGLPILQEIRVYCLQNALDHTIEAEWTTGVRAIILHRQPNICQQIKRTVPLETRCETGVDA